MERLARLKLGTGEFRNASLEEIGRFVENVSKRLPVPDHRKLNLFKIYTQFGHETPYFISYEASKRMIEAAKNDDPELSKKAANILTLLNLKTILGVIKPHLSNDNDRNNDLVQYSVVEVTDKAKKLNENISASKQIHVFMTKNVIPDFLEDENRHEFNQGVGQQSFDEILARENLSDALKEALGRLDFKPRQVLEMKYFDDLERKEICKRLGRSIQTVYQLESESLGRLRRYSSSSVILFGIWKEL